MFIPAINETEYCRKEGILQISISNLLTLFRREKKSWITQFDKHTY